MTSFLPLNGKKVLIPRGKNQAGVFSRSVRDVGGIPIEIPLLDFKPIDLTENVKQRLDTIHTYNWMVFTSSNAVEIFLSLFQDRNRDVFPKIAVIGEKTEKVVRMNGWSVDFIPSSFVAEVFVKEFTKVVNKGMRILIPKGNLARDLIQEHFSGVGVFVDDWVIYETIFPAASEDLLVALLRDHGVDILTFTSPSSVDHFMTIVKKHHLFDDIRHCLVASIGPITTQRLLHYGISVQATPKKFTVANMLESIIHYLNLHGGNDK